MEGFKIYISSDGYLIIPDLDIKYLIDFRESTIPSMPEAADTTVKIAGRDGDIVLSTTYEPIPFEIVCYTEDNLEPQEKINQESKINSFLNSIKNKTVALGMEAEEKFYDVKYSGSLTTTRFPKHIKFSIPLKASDPYAKFYIEREEIGNVTFESSTIKEVGPVFTITGPATKPRISLNGYNMYYDNSLLAGETLIINANNSTVTFINTNNEKSNAMGYYNHEFPKIKNGNNTLAVVEGITDDSQLKINWYDLKF